MKHLYLLRHGKSDWNAGSGSDHERPLALRGRKAAQAVGRFLTSLAQQPDVVLTSTAVRALTTAELAADAGNWSAEVEPVERLYLPTTMVVLSAVREQDGAVERLLVVGHEPTWSNAVGAFCGSARVRMVTAALARLDFSVASWRDVDFGGGELAWLVTPKTLNVEN